MSDISIRDLERQYTSDLLSNTRRKLARSEERRPAPWHMIFSAAAAFVFTFAVVICL